MLNIVSLAFNKKIENAIICRVFHKIDEYINIFVGYTVLRIRIVCLYFFSTNK